MTHFFLTKRTLVVIISVFCCTAVCLGIFFTALQATGDEIEDLQEQIRQKEEEQKRLQEQVSEYQAVIHTHQHEARTLQQHIASFDAEIQILATEIEVKKAAVETKRLEIEKTKIEINLKEELIEKREQDIVYLLQSLQVVSDQSFIEVILLHDSFSDFLDKVQARDQLLAALQEIVLSLQEERALLEIQKEELLQQEEDLINEQNELDAQNSILAEARQERAVLLSETRSSQAQYQNLLNQVNAQDKALREEIFQLEEELRKKLIPATLPQGTFIWPNKGGLITQGYGCLTSRFAVRSYPRCQTTNGQTGGFHNGVDIAAPLGSAILAADSGVVVGRSGSRYGYGNWVALRHANGVVTLYAHLSAISVGVGQHVSVGDRIGNMGSTGFSTGSHLHFVAYAPNTFRTVKSSRNGLIPIGATVNPYTYLSKIYPGQRTPK